MVAEMIPAGYLYKRVAALPAWTAAARHVTDIHSASSCISENFTDYIHHWQHNGLWRLLIRRGGAAEIAKAYITAATGDRPPHDGWET
jgi:hypothetical protein